MPLFQACFSGGGWAHHSLSFLRAHLSTLNQPFIRDDLATLSGRLLTPREIGQMNALDNASWYAIHTKPRQEERASENLAIWGVETLVAHMRPLSADKYLRPLFPGYIFARFDFSRMFRKIQFTRGVSYVVGFGGIPAPIEDRLIAVIRDRQGLGDSGWSETPLQAGDRVLIHSGPLCNFMGVFEKELPNHTRVQILLHTIARNFRVEVAKYEVARLPAGAAA
jgi:transcriptional antiterminator RfaH